MRIKSAYQTQAFMNLHSSKKPPLCKGSLGCNASRAYPLCTSGMGALCTRKNFSQSGGGLSVNNFFGHLKTITHHRHLVMRGCFRVGLYWQGLTHDLSKYSPTEFLTGVRYYQGNRSPNAAEREAVGYSQAWMHHKGRNRHHFEYWTDLDLTTRRYAPVPMPAVYLVEMVMDRIAACKTYQGPAYTDASPLEYLLKARETDSVHPDTMRKLQFLLRMLSEKGETETFRFIRRVVLRGGDFAP